MGPGWLNSRMWQRWIASAQMTRGHGGTIENYLDEMRRQDADMAECIPLIMWVERVDEARATEILDASPSWSDLRHHAE